MKLEAEARLERSRVEANILVLLMTLTQTTIQVLEAVRDEVWALVQSRALDDAVSAVLAAASSSFAVADPASRACGWVLAASSTSPGRCRMITFIVRQRRRGRACNNSCQRNCIQLHNSQVVGK